MIDDRALRLILEYEGFHKRLPDGRCAPYLCPAGVPTIGFGSVWRADGTHVAMTDPPMSRDEAMQLFGIEIEQKCLPAVGRLITIPLHPLMLGALVSFCFNAGGGALKASNLRRAVNERRWADVPAEFAKWRFGGGKELPGLVRRRAAEAAMFMAGVRDQSGEPIDAWATSILRAA